MNQEKAKLDIENLTPGERKIYYMFVNTIEVLRAVDAASGDSDITHKALIQQTKEMAKVLLADRAEETEFLD